MNLTDFASLSPLLILLAGAVLALLIERFTKPLTLGSITAALVATWYAPESNNPLLTDWIQVDSLAFFFTQIFIITALITTLLPFPSAKSEYYFLITTSLLGLILIAWASDYLTLFLGLETLSLSLYVLCGYIKKDPLAQEASLKYFLTGAIAASFLLYGIALTYTAIGTTRFGESDTSTLFQAGMALILLGLAFKAAIVPFHFWAPDVYEGASTPVVAFMAVATKAGAFAALARLFLDTPLIAYLAYPTLIYANILALRQTNLRRFFAYSGISHAGFLILPLAAGSLPALEFYLVIYSLATLGSFAILTHFKIESIHDLTGLFYKAPWTASAFALCLLTLAGMPPSPGFFAKFYIFFVAFQADYIPLVILGLLTSILAAVYYLRIITTLFSKEPLREV